MEGCGHHTAAARSGGVVTSPTSPPPGGTMPPARPDGSTSLRVAPPVTPGARPLTAPPLVGRALDIVERRRWRQALQPSAAAVERPRFEGRVGVDGKFFRCADR